MSRPESKRKWDAANADRMRELRRKYEKRNYEKRKRMAKERMRVKGQRVSLAEYWSMYRAQRAAGGPGYHEWAKQYNQAKHGAGWG